MYKAILIKHYFLEVEYELINEAMLMPHLISNLFVIFEWMKMKTNKVGAVSSYFNEQLSGIYETEEIQYFLFFSFEHILGFSRTDISLKKEEALNESTLLRFIYIVKDLKQFKPIQYILGNTEFYGLKFEVDANVLIPRQETEELVDLILKENKNTISNILDIGTGSGCIAISLQKNLPRASVYALDVSDKALEVAKRNAEANNTSIHFIPTDILKWSEYEFNTTFDIIVSNPPYVTFADKNKMHKNVLDYEPHLAMFVEDENPLLFYNAIADMAKQHLNSNGKLYFEINESFGNECILLMKEKGFKNIELIKDINEKYRIIKASN